MKTFVKICKMHKKNLKDWAAKQLKKTHENVIVDDGYVYAQGSFPVLLVAHMDTVHEKLPDKIYYSDIDDSLSSPNGIGGDDRCGVYMILQLIRDFKCHVLFCEDEECGGRGANKFTESKIKPDVNYIVEMDRRGSNDAVFYRCDNPDFTDFVLGFGFSENHGTFTDISVVAPYLKTAAVNISAGYFNEHRQHEYIDMLAVENNIRRIGEMIMADSKHFKYIKRCEDSRQLSMFGDWGWVPMELSRTQINDKRKLLMKIPDNARLITNGCEIAPRSRYFMDSEKKIYIFLEEIDAAVESEHSFAINIDGKELSYDPKNTKKISILTMEEAVEKLSSP